MKCKVKGCNYAKLHTTSAHCCGNCGNCGKLGHGRRECGKPYLILALKTIDDTWVSEKVFITKEAIKRLNRIDGMIYTEIPGALGSIWYARRSHNGGRIKLFVMGLYDWGQYGPMLDLRPKMRTWLSGYRRVV